MKITTLLLLSVLCLSAYAQQDDAETFYKRGMQLAQAGKYEDAINLLDQSIALKDDEYVSWYNRGILKLRLDRDEEAIPDFNQTIKLKPDYKKVYLSRGNARKHLTDYEGALADYTHAIELDSLYADAFYNRGLLYEKLSLRDSACNNFNRAYQLQMMEAHKKVEQCNDTVTSKTVVHPILRLTKTAATSQYGFSETDPIKVGLGPNGGPANQRDYLDLLRDVNGKHIQYERKSSCCPYPSENGFMGTAMLDIYRITYTGKDGSAQTADLYISFYDYTEPMIPQGFKTVGQ